MRAYADLLRSDFEGYIADIQEYFRCLDAERQRAFQEAREVSEDYGRLVELLDLGNAWLSRRRDPRSRRARACCGAGARCAG